MSEHTPGPWQICANETKTRGIDIIPVANIPLIIASVYVLPDYIEQSPRRANARLIAAAPDLLAVAKDCAAILTRIAEGKEWGAIEEFIDSARAAIAKAEGEQS